MNYKIGFIGTGVMGAALAKAVRQKCGSVLLSNKTEAKAAALAKELDCRHGDNAAVASLCEYIVLAVKPQVMFSVLEEIRPVLAARKDRYVLISIAAGIKIGAIKAALGTDAPVIRLMPNTPAAVGAGVVLCSFDGVTDDEKAEFFRLFERSGYCDEIKEELIDAAGSLTGCGPAFVYMVMQALSDGAVAVGVDRARATKYAEMTLYGAAELALKTGEHPEKLKDAVCSPGGSTIEGVTVLEKHAVRSAFEEAIKASYEKNKKLGE